MRSLFFAQSDDAVRLAASLGCGLLVGGMNEATVQAQLDAFEADPDALLVATAAFEAGWCSKVEAHVFFLAAFPGSMLSAINRVREPSVLPPTVQQLKDHASGGINLAPATLRLLYREPDTSDIPEASPAFFERATVKRLAAPCPEPVREQDEYKCTRCKIRWDVQEQRPPCRKGAI